ncbi:acetaldehyde dehydrogenase (acetylating) [Oceaniserpentilla sp. 4NH20-0058]|uniref:aldehyde dehydrogenase family protein n=1 Tax=Oceaniserpentilla sp. 4NH20-0058 TaxID=3127660 RepID=UPI0031079106
MKTIDSYTFLNYLSGFIHKTMSAQQCLIQQGSNVHQCFYIVSGEVAMEVQDSELDRRAQLPVLFKDGDCIGAKELLSGAVLPYNFIAKTNLEVIPLDILQLRKILTEQPDFYSLILQSLSKQFDVSLQNQVDNALNLAPIKEVEFIVSGANQAYAEIQTLPEEIIDQAIMAIAHEVNSHSEKLAQMVIMESGMGVLENKIQKIQLGTLAVAEDLKGKPGVGSIIEIDDGSRGVANSMGVVFAMIPVTNPVETLTFKCLIALKSRNAIIISSHRKAKNVGNETVKLIQKVLKQHNLPVNLVQTAQQPSSRALTQAFMAHEGVHFILATGGPSMVKSAYQSGTPAIGVGKGNAPVWIEKTCDVKKAAQDVVFSKSFDNGIVCGSENNLLVDVSIYDDFLQAAVNAGAAVFNDFELNALLEVVFSNNKLDSRFVGKSAQDVCDELGIKRDYPVKLILAATERQPHGTALLKEKLLPVLSVTKIQNDQQALDLAKAILSDEGAGHTAIMHSENEELVNQFAQYSDVSRVLVNGPGTLGCIGANNGLQLSWTLGCGTQGGGATSDNVSYKHLLNFKRIAYADN